MRARPKRTPLTPAHLHHAREALAQHLSQLEAQYPEIFSSSGEENDIKKIFGFVHAVLDSLKSLESDSLEKLFCDAINREEFGIWGVAKWAAWNGIKQLFRINKLKKKFDAIQAKLQPWMDEFSEEKMASLELAEVDPAFYVSAAQFLIVQLLYFVASLLDPIASKAKDQTRRVKWIEGVPDYRDEKALEAYIRKHFVRAPLTLASNTLFMLMSDPVSYCNNMLKKEAEKDDSDLGWLQQFKPMMEPLLNYNNMLNAFKKAELQWLNQCEGKVPYWLRLAKDGNAADIQQALTELSALQDRAEQYKIGSLGQLTSIYRNYRDIPFPEDYLIVFQGIKLPGLVAMPDEKDKTVLTFVPFKEELEKRLGEVRRSFTADNKNLQLANIVTQLQKRLGKLHPEDEPLLGLSRTQTTKDHSDLLVMTADSPNLLQEQTHSPFAAPSSSALDVQAMRKALFSLVRKGGAECTGALVQMKTHAESVEEGEVSVENDDPADVFFSNMHWQTVKKTLQRFRDWEDISNSFAYHHGLIFDNESKDKRWSYDEMLAQCQARLDQAVDAPSKAAWRRKMLSIVFLYGLGLPDASGGGYTVDADHWNGDRLYRDAYMEPNIPLISYYQFRALNEKELDDYSVTMVHMLHLKADEMEKEALSLMPGERKAQLDVQTMDAALRLCQSILFLIQGRGRNKFWSGKLKSKKPREEILEALWPFEDFKNKFNAMYPTLPIRTQSWGSILNQFLSSEENVTMKRDRDRIYWMLEKQYYRVINLVFFHDALRRLEPANAAVLAAEKGAAASLSVASQAAPQTALDDLFSSDAVPDNVANEAAENLNLRHEQEQASQPQPAPVAQSNQNASPAPTEPVTQPITITQPESKAPPFDKTKAREALARIAVAQSNAYLEARHQRFWLRDAMASLFAWLFTPEQTKRAKYLADLNKKLLDYAAAGDETSTQTVLGAINQGLNQLNGHIMTDIFLKSVSEEIKSLEETLRAHSLPDNTDTVIESMREEFFEKESKACAKVASSRLWFSLFHPTQCKALKKLAGEEGQPKPVSIEAAIQDYGSHYQHDLRFKPLIKVFVSQPAGDQKTYTKQ
jgi:hypothetical protein